MICPLANPDWIPLIGIIVTKIGLAGPICVHNIDLAIAIAAPICVKGKLGAIGRE